MPQRSSKASRKVAEVMHEFKTGHLHSGASGDVVKNPKQAVAIGLSEARQSGARVPPPPHAATSKPKAKPAASSGARPRKSR